MTETLRVAVIGAGRMGADHIQRLNTRIHGAEVAAFRHDRQAAVGQRVDHLLRLGHR